MKYKYFLSIINYYIHVKYYNNYSHDLQKNNKNYGPPVESENKFEI